MKKFPIVHYWFESICISRYVVERNTLPYFALLSTLTAILQLTGNFLPIVGLIISPFATLPIMMAAFLSKRAAVYTYCISVAMLLLLQPSEFFVFPFTTGLLGLTFGIGLFTVKRRIVIVFLSSISLVFGISILLYLIKFPILGPFYNTPLHLNGWTWLFTFSTLYSWLFFDICLYFVKKVQTQLK